MTSLKELDVAKMKEGLYDLVKGTVGTIVHIYKHKPDWCEFEAKGSTYTVPISNLEPA